MPTKKICPKCGSTAFYKSIVSPVLFGYVCNNCGCVFDTVTIQVGCVNWSEIEDEIRY